MHLTIHLTPEIRASLPAGAGVAAYAQYWQESEYDLIDNFERVPAEIDTEVVRLDVHPDMFTTGGGQIHFTKPFS